MDITTAARRYAEDPAFAEVAQARVQALLARSATDMDFRRKLLTEPRAAIAEFNGVDVSAIPESFNVRFVENTADATVVLPDPIDAERELADAELEAVAGGVTLITIPIVITITIYTYTTSDAVASA